MIRWTEAKSVSLQFLSVNPWGTGPTILFMMLSLVSTPQTNTRCFYFLQASISSGLPLNCGGRRVTPMTSCADLELYWCTWMCMSIYVRRLCAWTQGEGWWGYLSLHLLSGSAGCPERLRLDPVFKRCNCVPQRVAYLSVPDLICCDFISFLKDPSFSVGSSFELPLMELSIRLGLILQINYRSLSWWFITELPSNF